MVEVALGLDYLTKEEMLLSPGQKSVFLHSNYLFYGRQGSRQFFLRIIIMGG